MCFRFAEHPILYGHLVCLRSASDLTQDGWKREDYAQWIGLTRLRPDSTEITCSNLDGQHGGLGVSFDILPFLLLLVAFPQHVAANCLSTSGNGLPRA